MAALKLDPHGSFTFAPLLYAPCRYSSICEFLSLQGCKQSLNKLQQGYEAAGLYPKQLAGCKEKTAACTVQGVWFNIQF